jgi:hypothetical protein
MSKRSERPLALLAALALSACAVDDFGDAVMDTGAAVGIRDAEARTPEEEFPEVRTNCRLPSADLIRYGKGWRLSLPAKTYAARKSEPVAVRIACVTDWARGRGLTLVVAEAR